MSVTLTINGIAGELTLKSGETAKLSIHAEIGVTFNIKNISAFPDNTLFQLTTDNSGNASQDIQFTTDTNTKDIEIQAIQDWNPFNYSNTVYVHIMPVNTDLKCPRGDMYGKINPFEDCLPGYVLQKGILSDDCMCQSAIDSGRTKVTSTDWTLIAELGVGALIVIALLQSGILRKK